MNNLYEFTKKVKLVTLIVLVILFILITKTSIFSAGKPTTSPDNRFTGIKVNIHDAKILAEFPGGRQALHKYISGFRLSEEVFAYKKGQGLSYGSNLVLKIGEDGSVQVIKHQGFFVRPNIAVLQKMVKAELSTYFAKMPKWNPARENGVLVASTDTLRFTREVEPGVNYEEYMGLNQKLTPDTGPKDNSSEKLKTRDGKVVYTFVQKPAVYPGGQSALLDFVLRYFPELKTIGPRPVVVDIIINEEGFAENIGVLKPEGIKLNAEALAKALQQMPPWTPAKQNGKPLAFRHTFPLNSAN